jgi:Sensors of blue-light using FAD
MILIRLTYFSRIRLPGSINDHLREILSTSVANNRRDNVTGALVHDGKWFAQMLEGRESIVSATFERILRDHRHSDVSLVAMQPMAERRFGAWWMADIARNENNSDLFRHYGETECFDPHLMRVDRLCDLVEALADRAKQIRENKPWESSNATNAA